MNLNNSKAKPAIKCIENITNQKNPPCSSIANFLISKCTCSSGKNSLSKTSSFNLNTKENHGYIANEQLGDKHSEVLKSDPPEGPNDDDALNGEDLNEILEDSKDEHSNDSRNNDGSRFKAPRIDEHPGTSRKQKLPGCSEGLSTNKRTEGSRTKERSEGSETESTVLKINGSHFKPEEFINLPINNKLNVIGMQQHQIISNQVKLSVRLQTSCNSCNNNASRGDINMNDTLLIRSHLPIEDPDVFANFDNDLQSNATFRIKIWNYLQAYINKNDWKKTVRDIMTNVVTDIVQNFYSCTGRTGKKPFNQTLLYSTIEIETTRIMNKNCRPSISELQTYVSNHLKQAKNRAGGYENKRGDGSKKGKAKSSSRQKKNIKKEDLKKLALSLVPDGSNSDANESS